MRELGKDFAEVLKDGKWVVNAFAMNCKHCDNFAPIFSEAEKDFPDYTFARVNVTDVPLFRAQHMKDESRPPIERKGVKETPTFGTPTTIIFENGAMVARLVGEVSADILRQFITTKQVPPRPVDPSAQIMQRVMQLHGIKGECQTIIEFRSSMLNDVNKELSEIFNKHPDIRKRLLGA